MDVVVLTEYRFKRDHIGRLVSPTHTRGNSFWQRYLSGFDSVRVVARVDLTSSADGERVEGDGIEVLELPEYTGALQFLSRAAETRRIIYNAVSESSALIVRVPGILGSLASWYARKLSKPYGVELVGDPDDVFAPGAIRHPLRPLFRVLFRHATEYQARNAAGVSYVTSSALQRRYPSEAFQVSASSVELPEGAFAESPRGGYHDCQRFTLVTVGSLARPYKGVDVLIEAVAALRREGIDVNLRILGDGQYRTELERRVRTLQIDMHVTFLGRLPAGEQVRTELDRSDLFVMASRSEGLPRAMIEAMARGLPCVGTDVGGIPELLEDRFLVTPDRPNELAAKIKEIIGFSSKDITAVSARNIQVARTYHRDILTVKREGFYKHIHDATEMWYYGRSVH